MSSAVARARGASDERFMRRAVELAERGLGETNPNPAVGCVIVKNGRVVGEGFHRRAGAAHAEAAALRQAGARAKGATVYVTLEPCVPNALKRTPPCAPALVAAGIREVVYGAPDFNPRVKGAGARRLRGGGLRVTGGALAPETGRLVDHFNRAMKEKRPFITLKAGMTLDGRIATAAGESQWITSRSQRKAARRLRRLFDGVLVGIETVLKDNPLLLPEPRTRRPFLRVILDSRLRIPLDSRLVRSAVDQPLLVFHGTAPASRRAALEARGVSLLAVAESRGRVSVEAALNALFSRGVNSLMVEGGSEVHGSFVRAGVFDEMVLFRAPLILGGRGSRSVVAGDNPTRLSEAVTMRRARAATSSTLHYGLKNADDLDVEVYETVKGN